MEAEGKMEESRRGGEEHQGTQLNKKRGEKTGRRIRRRRRWRWNERKWG